MNILHDHSQGSRKYSSLFARQEVKQILLAILRRVIPDNGVSLSSTSLPISEYCNIYAIEELLDGIVDQIEDVLLCRRWREDIVEFHKGEVSGPLYMKSVVIFEIDESRIVFFVEDGTHSDYDLELVFI